MSANMDPPYMVISSSQLRMWPWKLCLWGPANQNKVSKWVELKGLVSWGRYDRHICWCKLTDAILASLFLWSAALCRRRVESRVLMTQKLSESQVTMREISFLPVLILLLFYKSWSGVFVWVANNTVSTRTPALVNWYVAATVSIQSDQCGRHNEALGVRMN